MMAVSVCVCGNTQIQYELNCFGHCQILESMLFEGLTKLEAYMTLSESSGQWQNVQHGPISLAEYPPE